MKIDSIKILNFKSFEDKEVSFSSQFNLVIGDNGKGKTALLDAVAVGLSGLLENINEDGSDYSIQNDWVRVCNNPLGEEKDITRKYPVTIECYGYWKEERFDWSQVKNGKNKLNNSLPQFFQIDATNNSDGDLPLFVYYSTDRLWKKTSSQPNTKEDLNWRNRGYKNCFDPDSSLSALQTWLEYEKQEELTAGVKSDRLEVVESALDRCMKEEQWQQITYLFEREEVCAEFTDGRILPIRMLSDGVRNMLAMVADIARRTALLNPHLGINAALETSGVVLIDEIDLHLHPTWQRRVVEDLHRTFPNLQFVATTHSPFIIQSLEAVKEASLINLDSDERDFTDKSIEEIAEYVQGVPDVERSQHYQNMKETAKEYYRLIQESKGADPEKIQETKAKLDELMIPYYRNPAYATFLEMKREAAGLGEEE